MVKGAIRSGSASASHTSVDLVKLAQEKSTHTRDIITQAESHIENAIGRTRQLRLAGMINKSGADEICNSLIHALQSLEDMK